ncbi:MAG: hypothetical protein ABSG84_19040 [Acidobacteriaceae bacterium]
MPTPSESPTEAQVYSIYQNLLDTINHEIFATADPDVLQVLEPASQALTDLLDDDDMVHLEANTALFAALTPEMKTANDALKTAQAQIAAVADKLADAGKVISALTQVLTTAAKFA